MQRDLDYNFVFSKFDANFHCMNLIHMHCGDTFVNKSIVETSQSIFHAGGNVAIPPVPSVMSKCSFQITFGKNCNG